VSSIGDSAFFDCNSLTNVVLPNGIAHIGSTAFGACSSLTGIAIPGSVTKIEDWAFWFCTRLSNVILGNGTGSVGNWAFSHCMNLISIAIPNSVTNIGEYAFDGCSNLAAVFFRGDAPNLNGLPVFNSATPTVYYLPGTIGWSATFGGRPTALWALPQPLILSQGPDFGVQANQFGFRVSWATNVPVVVEACANLAAPVWSPVSTNTLFDGWFYFSDPEWTNYPSRLYRVRSQ
jgi:hypothetical protein